MRQHTPDRVDRLLFAPKRIRHAIAHLLEHEEVTVPMRAEINEIAEKVEMLITAWERQGDDIRRLQDSLARQAAGDFDQDEEDEQARDDAERAAEDEANRLR